MDGRWNLVREKGGFFPPIRTCEHLGHAPIGMQKQGMGLSVYAVLSGILVVGIDLAAIGVMVVAAHYA